MEFYLLDKKEKRRLENYKKIKSFINYLKENEISYKIVDMNFREEQEDGDMIIDFGFIFCGFSKTPQNIKMFEELKEKGNGVKNKNG